MKKLKMLFASLFAFAFMTAVSHADEISELQTAATEKITAVVAAVVVVIVAGFAITGLMWAARKMKSSLTSS